MDNEQKTEQSHKSLETEHGKSLKLSNLLPGCSPDGVLDFLNLTQSLKINKRNGWINKGIPESQTESIADHMFRMSIMAQLVRDPALDMHKCIRMALVHDMAEAITGDFTPEMGYSKAEKSHLEAEAMGHIKNILQGNPFGSEAFSLWREYEADETDEAHFVKDLDKLEFIIKAGEYEKSHGIDFDAWIEGSKDKIRHSALKAVLEAALQRRFS